MKKCYFLICVILINIFCFSACNKNIDQINENYFYQINSLIKNADFHTAKVEDYKIILYNLENELTQEIVFEDYNNGIKLRSVRKEGSIIYFITGGSVDDEKGVIFINDDTNNMFDGIKSIKRIGGNSYQYSTSE